MDVDQLLSLRPALEAFAERFRPCFAKGVTFEHFRCYVLGLLADLPRKSVEPMALSAGIAVRTLQEFLSQFRWDHERIRRMMQLGVAGSTSSPRADRSAGGIGVIDATGHLKQGRKTPGVHRQYCGETGKVDNCVVAQHLLFTDDDPSNPSAVSVSNPFCCMLASDLFLPEAWAEDRARCREAGIPDDLPHRTKWRIALDQVKEAVAAGVKFDWLVFDEDYGKAPAFWFELDRMGMTGVGEVPADFHCWVKRPACNSVGNAAHAARRVDNLLARSPAFTHQPWQSFTVRQGTLGPIKWEYKSARVHLNDDQGTRRRFSRPTDRMYWLIVMRRPAHNGWEYKYVLSNAAQNVTPQKIIQVLLSRWRIEKWFERAKQEAGLGAFEVRNYTGLMRHWLCVSLAMGFLTEQTTRLRGEKSAHHLRAGRPRRQTPGRPTLETALDEPGGDDHSSALLATT